MNCKLTKSCLTLLQRPFGKRISLAFYFTCPILAFYLLEFLTHNPFADIHFSLHLFSWLLYLLFYSVCFLLLGQMKRAFSLATFLIMGVAILNFYTLRFRSSPLLPWDIRSIGTAVSVAGNQTFDATPLLAGITGCFVLLILLSLRCELPIPSLTKRIAAITGSVALMGLLISGLRSNILINALDIYEMPFTQWYTYRQNGFLVSYLMNTKYLSIQVPASYDVQNLQEVVADAEENGPAAAFPVSSSREKQDTQPNIIVIMNEAFSDLSVLGDFETNQDYLPFFHSLTDNAICGSTYVSVLGGNTANSEFEFLTGDSMAFLPTGSIPYQQYVHSQLPSLVDVLSVQGYHSIAMHPYYATGWNREAVYDFLGFDETYFLEDFTNASYLRQYVSDWSMFEKIIELYEQKKDGEPLFLFGVTMQNHSGYTKEYDNFEQTIHVLDGDYHDADTYLSLIYESDQAFERLVEYFSHAGEDTLIVMFGDHQPTSLENDFFTHVLGEDPQLLSLEEIPLRYQTPFKIWANYDIPEISGENISLNYLGTLLMQVAGLQLSDYQEYLWNIHETLPVITAHFCVNAEGQLYGYNAENAVPDNYQDLLDDYSALQYNHLFDEENRLTKLFLLPSDKAS